jgi:CDP-L-myo-inositol myo-inositolphosphotransferase
MKCLIIAAGQGTRLKKKGEVKPLVSLLGVPLIERVIRSAIEGGATEFYVVTGYQEILITNFLKSLEERLQISLTLIHNDEWQAENGLSVLKARDRINDQFLLLMADHLFDPDIIRSLLDHPLNEGDVLLAVDTDTQNSLVDMEDVTKVHIQNGKILNIGKTIDEFNGFDTGCFLCTTAIFEAIEEAQNIHHDTTLSGAIRVLGERQHAKAVPTQKFWIDVDDDQAFGKAERYLMNLLKGKIHDGPISRLLNRPVSIRCSKILVNFNFTPNQISIFSFLLSLFAAAFFAMGEYRYLVFGGIMAQLASIIDGCDGEVARLKYLSSNFGGWFDAVLDRYADAFLLFGLTWHVYSTNLSSLVFVIGFMAIIGSFMVSYTADKHDNLMKNKIHNGLRIGRDVNVFLLFLAAISNQPYLGLMVIAVLMNFETIRRIIVCRNEQ